MEDILKGIKALGDETRLKIIQLLLSKNYCVGALAKELDISESAVSQQLKILRKADLVIGEKRGYYVHYTVKTSILQEIGQYICNLEEKNIKKNCGETNDCCHTKD